MKEIKIDRKYLEINIKKIKLIYSLLILYDIYLWLDNFQRGIYSTGIVSLIGGSIPAITLVVLLGFRPEGRTQERIAYASIVVSSFVYWFIFGWFMFTGGTAGTSIFLVFMAAPVAYYFFNLFFGSIFCGVLFLEVALYMWTPLSDYGYQFPEMYEQRLPMFLFIETVLCALAQYEAVKAGIMQDRAIEEAKFANSAKTDFLANTSHEIRTPMNSILGFCELILREDSISARVRDYCLNIQSAGDNLLHIINDILDVSKIEAGKIEIVDEEFKLERLVKDVVNVSMMRKKERGLELIVDMDGNIPARLYGDMGRIRQIMINLVTNAIKYTSNGGIYMRIGVKRKDTPILVVRVEDTGVGIKPEDLERIFQSFEQVDKTRTRPIEGTGLGLTISKRLADLMGGVITVESEYGCGAVFTMWIPVKIRDLSPIIKDHNSLEEEYGICTDINNIHPRLRNKYNAHIEDMCSFLHMRMLPVPTKEKDRSSRYEGLKGCFVDAAIYEEYKERFDRISEKTEIILIGDDFSQRAESKDLKMIYKPLYLLSFMDFVGKDAEDSDTTLSGAYMRFTAPTAKVLLVDDNPINLRVERGLMEIYDMDITTASSGMEALHIADKVEFDIIFMDHMMPEMDGIETMKRIHGRDIKRNKGTPVIALTANAVKGIKEMFLENGFNGFISKPIDLNELDRILRSYIPRYKIIENTEVKKRKTEKLPVEIESMLNESELFDYDEAMRNRIDEENLLLYMKGYEKNFRELQEFFDAKDWENYTLQVHSLKSSSRMIGAVKLSELAEKAEKLSKIPDETGVFEIQDEILKLYTDVFNTIKKYVF
ncbi:Signal transduction histidine kinase [Lachnospiraceae bacterium]|nr:Signal transduction histidine kinase [Lachnospiraceae bacterium]